MKEELRRRFVDNERRSKTFLPEIFNDHRTNVNRRENAVIQRTVARYDDYVRYSLTICSIQCFAIDAD